MTTAGNAEPDLIEKCQNKFAHNAFRKVHIHMSEKSPFNLNKLKHFSPKYSTL